MPRASEPTNCFSFEYCKCKCIFLLHFVESLYATKSNGHHSKRASDEIVDITDDDDAANEEDDDDEQR